MSKRKLYTRVGWRKYLDVDHSPRVEMFLKKNGFVVFNQILDNLEEAIENDEGEVLILVHRNAGAIVSIQTKDFKEVLEFSLQYFLKDEHYSECARITKLLKSLESPKLLKSKKEDSETVVDL